MENLSSLHYPGNIFRSSFLKLKTEQVPLLKGTKGKPVKTGCGPAAVTGDDLCNMSLSVIIRTGRRRVRTIRKPEDLPVAE